MRRLLLRSVLAGLALARPATASAASCAPETQCDVPRPLLLFIVDDSTSMNAMLGADTTRWDATREALIAAVNADNGDLARHTILGLMRFGHDPDPGAPGTTIPGDTSLPPLTDGQAIDLRFYDEQAPDQAYFVCGADALTAALTALPAPLQGALTGVESWTKGALDRADAYFTQTAADHPLDAGARPAAIVLITDGEWTDPTGTVKLGPPIENPGLTAKALFVNRKIPTYVVALGEAAGQKFADNLASSGGTGSAHDVITQQALGDALVAVVADVKARLLAPRCSAARPRVMVLLDASSSMLNVDGDTQAGSQGTTGWDQARDTLSGLNSLFDQLTMTGLKSGDQGLFGLAVFGDVAPPPGEQRVLVDYGTCRKNHVAWALDPGSSCVPPGCTDPWSGPPIAWTFQDGSQLDPPGFLTPTLSHMPRCDLSAEKPLACAGSGAATHLGLQLVQQNLAAYKALCAAPNADDPCDPDTRFVNILVTDGSYDASDAEVQAPLQAMHAAGVTTRVIGLGDLVDPDQLDLMASWGSGGALPALLAQDQLELESALFAVVDGLDFDPCCPGLGCPVPPDPLPPPDDPICGDGEVAGGEACDDGNDLEGDGCFACQIEGDTSSGGSAGSTGEGSTGAPASSSGTTLSPSTDSGAPTTGSVGATTTTTTAAGTTAGTSDSAGTGPLFNPGIGCACATDPEAPPHLLLSMLLIAVARRRRRCR